jgi:hypothetical protein
MVQTANNNMSAATVVPSSSYPIAVNGANGVGFVPPSSPPQNDCCCVIL